MLAAATVDVRALQEAPGNATPAMVSAAEAPAASGELPSEAVLEEHYDRAWALVKESDYDEALEEFIWLWDATNNKESAFEPRIRGRIIESIGRVAKVHAPTREHFSHVLDDLETFLRGNPPPPCFREWMDWPDFCRALGQEDRILNLYEERRAPDGSLKAFTGMHPYAMDDAFDLLVERKRFAEAGRFHADLMWQARFLLSLVDDLKAEHPDWATSEQRTAYRRRNEEDVALLYALGLAAGRTSESAEVAALLLEKADCAESRKALVTACLRVGVLSDEIPRWLTEMTQAGVETADIEAQVAELRAR